MAAIAGTFSGSALTWYSDAVGGTQSQLMDASTAGVLTLQSTTGDTLLVKNVTDPVDAQDVATKAYVDNAQPSAPDFTKLTAVAVATTGPGVLSNGFENGNTIDGVVLATGDRILIKDQAAATENGVYVVAASGAPARAADMPAAADAEGMWMYVSGGTLNSNYVYICQAASGTATVGTDPLVFSTFVMPVMQNFALVGNLSLVGSSLTSSTATVSFGSDAIVTTGTATAANFNSSSDRSLKENVVTVENALDIVSKIRGVRFDWKDTSKSDMGVIAQELAEEVPEVVSTNPTTGLLQVDYGRLTPILANAISELREEVRLLRSAL